MVTIIYGINYMSLEKINEGQILRLDNFVGRSYYAGNEANL
jgi:hypothetical protein